MHPDGSFESLEIKYALVETLKKIPGRCDALVTLRLCVKRETLHDLKITAGAGRRTSGVCLEYVYVCATHNSVVLSPPNHRNQLALWPILSSLRPILSSLLPILSSLQQTFVERFSPGTELFRVLICFH